MKKSITYLVMILLAISLVSAVSVTRVLPKRANPNSELTVKLKITNADSTGLLTLEEELPKGISIKDWKVIGAKEPKDKINTREKDNRFGWSFTPSGSSATVEYKIKLGKSDVDFGTLIYFDKSGYGKVDPESLKVAPITCGDGICEGNENPETCAADCPKKAETPKPEETPKAEETPKTQVKEEEEEVTKIPTIGIAIAAVVLVIIVILVYLAKKKK